MASTRQVQYQLMLRGVQEDLSGAQLLRALREAGLGFRTQEFYRLLGQARVAVAEAGLEPTRPLEAAPTPAETAPLAAGPRAEPGYLQTVRLIYRENVTGKMRTVYFSSKNTEPLTRQEVIDQAVDSYATHSADYETSLIAAAHTSTLQIVPTELVTG